MTAPRRPRVDHLIERSSLGGEGARELRARTTEEQLERVRRLADAPAEEASDIVYDEVGAETTVRELAVHRAAKAEVGSVKVVTSGWGRDETEADRHGGPADGASAGSSRPTESDRRLAGAMDRVGDVAADLDRLDDSELVLLHVSGNSDAFGFLVRRYRDRMWLVAIRTLSDPEEAADALQEAFISAFRRADSFRGDVKVITWLHRIVVNSCLDRIRRRQVRVAVPLPEDEDRAAEPAGPTEEDPAEVRERRIDVLNALKQLNEDQRSALVLVDIEGYSIEEAAAILGCAPGTVKSRCARGRARLIPLLRHQPSAPDPAREPAPQPTLEPTARTDSDPTH